MNVQVTKTKLVVPRRRDELLTRPRLLRQLARMIERRLTIVAAPAGYGKTWLLIDFAHESDLPICWYGLDALDRDPLRFLSHFFAAIEYRFPDFGAGVWGALEQAGRGKLDIHRLVTLAVNDIFETISSPFVLVLDDYHYVDDVEEISEFLNRFVREVDEDCHTVLVTRTLPSLSDLPLMTARSQVAGLSFQELAFRPDEIQALVLQNNRITLPVSAAEQLTQESEGWITGVRLSAQAMWSGISDPLQSARVSGENLYEYLADQVLDQQTGPMREFLLQSSIMEEFSTDLCAQVLGDHRDWQEYIDAVLRDNLFALRVGEDGGWVRYHQLFRDFLRERLKEEEPQTERDLLLQLAEVYTQREEWERALQAYQTLDHPEGMARLIEAAHEGMIRRGRLSTLSRWLNLLPGELLRNRLSLCSLQGIVQVMLGEVPRGITVLSDVIARSRKAGDWQTLSGALARRAIAERFRGEYRQALADAEEVLALADAHPISPQRKAEALRAKGLVIASMGRIREAIDWLTAALDTYLTLDDPQSVAMLHLDLGFVLMNAGEYQRALEHDERALEHWEAMRNIVQQASVRNNIGVTHYYRGDYVRAAEVFEEAIDCARRGQYSRVEALVLAGLGDLYLDLVRGDIAEQAYSRALAIAREIHYRFLRVYLQCHLGALAVTRGDPAAARSSLRQAEGLLEENESLYEAGLVEMLRGRISASEGDWPAAIESCERALAGFEEGGQVRDAVRARMLLAVCHAQQGDRETGVAWLEAALTGSEELESDHALVVLAAAHQPAVQMIANGQGAGPEISALLDRAARFQNRIPELHRELRPIVGSIPVGAAALRIRALGRSQVWWNGERVQRGDWQTYAARDLFFCLLAYPEGLTKEGVAAIFWPESSPEQVKTRFKNTIYRLRGALSQEVVEFEDDRYTFNRRLDYEYDVEAFQEKMRLAQHQGGERARAGALQEALRYYQGAYLPEVDGPWVLPERERLRRQFIQGAADLATICLEKGDFAGVIDWCRRVHEVDPCQENCYRLAMRAYAALGNQPEVARQFEQCERVLREELQVSPSEQTRQLFRDLTG